MHEAAVLAVQVLIRGDPDVKMSMTSCKDIARWLPNILMDPASKNATVNVCSQVVSMREAVEIFEDVSGKQKLFNFCAIEARMSQGAVFRK